MDAVQPDYRAFSFVVSLAAVVNALGIVRWLGALAEYLKRHRSVEVGHDWVFSLCSAHQFLLHILLWWTLWGAKDASSFNFLIYLYMLVGPVLLYLGTTLLVPDIEEAAVDLRAHYLDVRRSYFTLLSLVWLWAIVRGPVLYGEFAANASVVLLYLVVALSLRITANRNVHAIGTVANWLLFASFIALFAMNLGGPP